MEPSTNERRSGWDMNCKCWYFNWANKNTIVHSKVQSNCYFRIRSLIWCRWEVVSRIPTWTDDKKALSKRSFYIANSKKVILIKYQICFLLFKPYILRINLSANTSIISMNCWGKIEFHSPHATVISRREILGQKYILDSHRNRMKC